MITEKQLAVGVVSAPRVTNYLPLTVTDLLTQTQRIHVRAEPNTVKINDDRICWYQNETIRGQAHNWLDLVRTLYEQTEAPYLLLCEDDIRLAPNALATCCDWMPKLPNIGLLSLYVPATFQQRIATYTKPQLGGVHVVQNHFRQLWGACALCLPRTVADDLIHSPKFLATARLCSHLAPDDDPARVRCGDVAIVQLIRQRVKANKIFVAHPALVQHIGAVSSLDNPPITQPNRHAAVLDPELADVSAF